MYDKNFYDLVADGTSAFKLNSENEYVAGIEASAVGVTNDNTLSRVWPESLSSIRADYNAMMVTIDPTVSTTNYNCEPMSDGTWLIEFQLRVKETATAGDSGTVYMSNDWTRTADNIMGTMFYGWAETGDASVFRGISQDSIVMNIDDLLCIGAVERILLSNTVNRNAKNFTGKALAQLILGSEDFLAKLRKLGVKIFSGGGETADVGDLTGAVVVDSCAVAVMERKNVITGAEIKPNLAIVGLSSAGKAKYEDFENSGIGSNGLTSARHDMLSPYYRKKYPETYDSNTDKKLVYCGPFKLEDKLEGSNMTVGQALLSPTRTYAPVIMKLLKMEKGEEPSVEELASYTGLSEDELSDIMEIIKKADKR
jgi:hypothetical protein